MVAEMPCPVAPGTVQEDAAAEAAEARVPAGTALEAVEAPCSPLPCAVVLLALQQLLQAEVVRALVGMELAAAEARAPEGMAKGNPQRQ